MTEAERLRKFAELGPFYLVVPKGFVSDEPGRPTTVNLRYAKNFPTWIAADTYARTLGVSWWSILRTAYVDLALDIPAGIAQYYTGQNPEDIAAIEHQRKEFERLQRRKD